jgi:hypothetical protein
MKIYPNPTRYTAYLCRPNELQKGGRLRIRNCDGEIIEARSFTENNSTLLSIDLSKQPIDLYKVSMSDDNLELRIDLLNLVSAK